MMSISNVLNDRNAWQRLSKAAGFTYSYPRDASFRHLSCEAGMQHQVSYKDWSIDVKTSDGNKWRDWTSTPFQHSLYHYKATVRVSVSTLTDFINLITTKDSKPLPGVRSPIDVSLYQRCFFYVSTIVPATDFPTLTSALTHVVKVPTVMLRKTWQQTAVSQRHLRRFALEMIPHVTAFWDSNTQQWYGYNKEYDQVVDVSGHLQSMLLCADYVDVIQYLRTTERVLSQHFKRRKPEELLLLERQRVIVEELGLWHTTDDYRAGIYAALLMVMLGMPVNRAAARFAHSFIADMEHRIPQLRTVKRPKFRSILAGIPGSPLHGI
jgi:hypothetical protein